MSAIKRGVKKVFRGVKRVIKKIPKEVWIAGAILLTGGLAAGGFAAFGAVGSATGMAAKTSAFFGAVGQTMAAGAQAIAGSIGVGSGITGTGMTSAFAGTAGQGATLGTGVLAQGLGLSAGPAAAAPLASPVTTAPASRVGEMLSGIGIAPQAASSAAAAAAPQATGGFLGKAMGAFKGMSDIGQMAVVQGIFGGMQSMAEAREMRRQEKRADSLGIFGAQRRGGGGVIEGDFGAAVREGFGLDAAPTTASAGLLGPAPMSQFRDIDPRQQEEEEIGTLAGGFGLERGLLAQSQANMPQFV